MRRTRSALQDALAALVEEDAPITMSAVAQRAGLSRQVLHTHYESIEQLATEVLTRRLLEGTGHSTPVDQDASTRAAVAAIRHHGLGPFLTFIQRDRHAFLTLRRLAHGGITAVMAQVFVGLANDLASDLTAAPGDGAAALFVAGGMTASMDAWLSADAPKSAAEQAARLKDFARGVFVADGQQDQIGPER